MAEKTANYSLTKPAPEDFYDISVSNANMDKIDAGMKANADKIKDLQEGQTNKADLVNGKVPTEQLPPMDYDPAGSANAVQVNLNTHINDVVKHITTAERTAWNAKADAEDIPTKTSDLTNDSGYLTGYTETDPTVPAWAKAESKPTYTAAEVGAAAESHTHDDRYYTETEIEGKNYLQKSGGTMTGILTAVADTTPATAKVRNSSLHSTETAPTANGTIAWTYE